MPCAAFDIEGGTGVALAQLVDVLFHGARELDRSRSSCFPIRDPFERPTGDNGERCTHAEQHENALAHDAITAADLVFYKTIGKPGWYQRNEGRGQWGPHCHRPRRTDEDDDRPMPEVPPIGDVT